MPTSFNRDRGQRDGEIASGYRNDNGSVAAEFALMAPILVLIATGIADFGMLATKSVGLAATARIGAEYRGVIRPISAAYSMRCRAQ